MSIGMPHGIEVQSCGLRQTSINQQAVTVMKDAGIDISSQQSQSIDSFNPEDFDVVISMCGCGVTLPLPWKERPIFRDWNLGKSHSCYATSIAVEISTDSNNIGDLPKVDDVCLNIPHPALLDTVILFVFFEGSPKDRPVEGVSIMHNNALVKFSVHTRLRARTHACTHTHTRTRTHGYTPCLVYSCQFWPGHPNRNRENCKGAITACICVSSGLWANGNTSHTCTGVRNLSGQH